MIHPTRPPLSFQVNISLRFLGVGLNCILLQLNPKASSHYPPSVRELQPKRPKQTEPADTKIADRGEDVP